jgi:transposase
MDRCSPRCRTEPFPLIWQVSRAYKARPHAGADYITPRHRSSCRGCRVCLVAAHRSLRRVSVSLLQGRRHASECSA